MTSFTWTSQTPSAEEMAALRQAIEQCRTRGERVSVPTARGDAYAYPAPRGGVSFGINGGEHGCCSAQGRG